jgi:hypothetical protein
MMMSRGEIPLRLKKDGTQELTRTSPFTKENNLFIFPFRIKGPYRKI